VDLTEPHSSFY